MRILLLGGAGQLGVELARRLRRDHELHVASRDGHLPDGTEALSVDLDLPVRLREVMREARPELVVNCAAYTAVDRAEREPEAAHRINAVAPGVLAEEAGDLGAVLLHFSTDYVFSGEGDRPWRETDPTVSINIYGHSKLGGEEAIRLRGGPHLILRTGWVYAAHGRNFLRTMLRLARERDRLEVVDDQTGAPTWAGALAEGSAGLIAQLEGEGGPAKALGRRGGTYHLVNAGSTTWCGFAREIFRRASLGGLLDVEPEVAPVTSAQFGAEARRPKYSVLDCTRIRETFGIALPAWQDSLTQCLGELPEVSLE